jgi:hypothetical protein
MATTSTTRTLPEVTAWILWVVAFLIAMIPTTMAMNTMELTLDQRSTAVVQFVAVAWVVLAAGAYFWRRGGGHGQLDAIIWAVVLLAIPVVTAVLAPQLWSVLTTSIPYSVIF